MRSRMVILKLVAYRGIVRDIILSWQQAEVVLRERASI